MRFSTKTAVLSGALALMASPAMALPSQVPSNSGTAHIPSNQGTSRAPSGTLGGSNNPGVANQPNAPGPSATLPAKAKAYGKYCQNESKTHVAGTPGTPFSKCVTAMAKLASGTTRNPRTACKGESKEHVAGTPGTPFSKCVSDGAKLLQNQSSS